MAAIYQWFPPEGLVIATSTLYPVEVDDAVTFSCNITYGEMRIIPEVEYDQSGDLLGIDVTQLLYSWGPDDLEYDQAGDLIGITVTQILYTWGPDDLEYDQAGDLLGITVTSKLVTIDTPDEKLQLSCDINPSKCSMTPV